MPKKSQEREEMLDIAREMFNDNGSRKEELIERMERAEQKHSQSSSHHNDNWESDFEADFTNAQHNRENEQRRQDSSSDVDRFRKFVGDLALTKAQKDKIVNSNLNYIHSEKMKLVAIIQELHQTSLAHALSPNGKYQLLSDTKENYDHTLKKVTLEIENLFSKILLSPAKSADKEVTLLNDLASNLIKFSNSPSNETKNGLIASSNAVYKKMGPFWTGLKAAVAGAIGMACIVVGILGLVPSMGASVGLIAGGAALCVAAGLTQFNKMLPPTVVSTKNIAKEIPSLIAHAKKAGHLPPVKKQDANKHLEGEGFHPARKFLKSRR